jgi:hypothetical protein
MEGKENMNENLDCVKPQVKNYQGLVENLQEYNLNKKLKDYLTIINSSLVKKEKDIKVHLNKILQNSLINEEEFEFLSAKMELGFMCKDLELVLEGISVTMLFYDETRNKVFHGACPSIPVEFFDFFKIINELGTLNKNTASCGRAIFTRKVVQTDIGTSPLWVELKEHYIENGFLSCISIPFYNRGQQVAGTFALLSKDPNYKLKNNEVRMVQEKTAMYEEEIQRISDRFIKKGWETISS